MSIREAITLQKQNKNNPFIDEMIGSLYYIEGNFKKASTNFNKALEAVDELKNILPEGITLSQLSLKWILMHDAVSIVIPGAKNKDHVGLNTSSSELDTISSLMNEINSVYTKYFFDDVHHRW